MSREELRTSIHAVEHSSTLREEVKKYQDTNSILNLALDYGFSITNKDLKENNNTSIAMKYFKINKFRA